jgi:hypothetical protein
MSNGQKVRVDNRELIRLRSENESLRSELERLRAEQKNVQQALQDEAVAREQYLNYLLELRMLVATLTTGMYQAVHLFNPADMVEAGRRIEAMMTAQLRMADARQKVSATVEKGSSEKTGAEDEEEEVEKV